MAKELDVYRDWLGVKEANRPLSHYQLLRLPPFEDDPSKIRTHYRKMNEHVRKFGTGEYADQSQALLNDLAKSMLCLTDLQRKREYDASMGRETADEGRRRSLEEILLAGQVVDQAQLDKARGFSDAVGVELHQAVLQQKLAEPEAVMMAYAESIGLPYLDLKDIGIDASLAGQIPPTLARQHSFVPVMADAQHLLMASPTPLVPDVEEELRLRFEMPVRTVLCTPSQVNEAIADFFPRDAPDPGPVKASKKKGKDKKKGKGKDAEKAAKPAKEEAEGERLSDEEFKKRRTVGSAIVLNVAVWGSVGIQYLIAGVEPVNPIVAIGIGFGIGLAAGGITWAVLSKR
jgi:type II secretion system (T2SS) protein E